MVITVKGMAVRASVCLALLVSTASAMHSTRVFDSHSTSEWADGVCFNINNSNITTNSTNTTTTSSSNNSNSNCEHHAKECFRKVKRARSFLQEMSSSYSLQDRCKQKRATFDRCSEEANLNATWKTITGSDRSCERSFLRGLRSSIFGRFGRSRRSPQTKSGSGWQQQNWRYNTAFGFPYVNNKIDEVPRPRFNYRIVLGRFNRRNRRRVPRSTKGSVMDKATKRVATFLERVESINPEAMKNYTSCIWREEGLLTETNTIARSEFRTWAGIAFIKDPKIAAAVREAMENCEEPQNGELASFMQCWGAACARVAIDNSQEEEEEEGEKGDE